MNVTAFYSSGVLVNTEAITVLPARFFSFFAIWATCLNYYSFMWSEQVGLAAGFGTFPICIRAKCN